MKRTATRLLALLLLATGGCRGCSYFEIRRPGLPTLLANTMEYSVPLDARGWKLVSHRPGEQFPSLCEGGDPWTSALPYLAMENPLLFNQSLPNISTASVSVNAMNVHGLAVSGHAFRGGADYTPPSGRVSVRACELTLGQWAVATFKTVAELRSSLPAVAVDGQDTPSTPNPGLQWAFADASGDSVVVDYMDGNLRVMNNSVGVLTNDPEFIWQLRNLNNYAALSNNWPQSGLPGTSTQVGAVPQPIGHGLNLLGLPGDPSPPSRFIRLYYHREFTMLARPPSSMAEALTTATGLLNTVHILPGLAAGSPGEPGLDYTQFATLKVPSERLLMFRTYEDMQWRKVDLRRLDWSKPVSLPLVRGHEPQDVTVDFS